MEEMTTATLISSTCIAVLSVVWVVLLYSKSRDGVAAERQMTQSNIIQDITVPFSSELVAFDGDKGIGKEWLTLLSSVHDGDDFTTTQLSIKSHYGTHLDAFRHIAPRGGEFDKRDPSVGDDIDSLDLYVLMGKCMVVDVGDVPLIDADVLQSLYIPPHVERVLFKTRNTANRLMSKTQFDTSYVALDDTGARYIVERTKIKVCNPINIITSPTVCVSLSVCSSVIDAVVRSLSSIVLLTPFCFSLVCAYRSPVLVFVCLSLSLSLRVCVCVCESSLGSTTSQSRPSRISSQHIVYSSATELLPWKASISLRSLRARNTSLCVFRFVFLRAMARQCDAS